MIFLWKFLYNWKLVYKSSWKKEWNLAKYEKNEILQCRKKKKFSFQTYRQKNKNVPNLQVIQKEMYLSHLPSNKTACTECLTNWIALIGSKIKSQRAVIVLTVVSLYWVRPALYHYCLDRTCAGIHNLNF